MANLRRPQAGLQPTRAVNWSEAPIVAALDERTRNLLLDELARTPMQGRSRLMRLVAGAYASGVTAATLRIQEAFKQFSGKADEDSTPESLEGLADKMEAVLRKNRKEAA